MSDVMTAARTLYEFHTVDSGPVEADFILACGSHDLRSADRAADLYLAEAAAPLIVCSGGFGKVTREIWKQTEAARYAERCGDLGVPKDSILVEDAATNTGENFTKSRSLLENLGHSPKSGIIVTKPYMSQRALATGRMQWPEVTWSSRPPLIDFEEYPNHEVPLDRMVNLMVGDLQRLSVYAEQGFQVPVEVPDRVKSAFDTLVAAGFTQFLLPS